MTPEERAEAYIAGPPRTHMFADDRAQTVKRLADMIRAAVAEERETCARVAEAARVTRGTPLWDETNIAAAIRARGA